MISHADIATALALYWADEFPLGVSTRYPGTRLDTAQLDEWLELQIDDFQRRPSRGTSELIDVDVTLHCFVKPGTRKNRVHELADAVRATIERKSIDITDSSASGAPLVGRLQMREARTHDLTRGEFDSLRSHLAHQIVSIRGFVHPL